VGIAGGTSTGAQGPNTATATSVAFNQARPEQQHGEGKPKKIKNRQKQYRQLQSGLAKRDKTKRRADDMRHAPRAEREKNGRLPPPLACASGETSRPPSRGQATTQCRRRVGGPRTAAGTHGTNRNS